MAIIGCSKNQPHDHTDVSNGHIAEHREHNHGNPADLERYIARLESPDRAEWQKPDEVVARLALAEGSVACEIGAGPGYFSLRLANAVGDAGSVYAVEVEPRILAVLRERIETSTVRNVIPILGLVDDPLLPMEVCDLILVVNTLHHFPQPVTYLKRLRRSLKRDGRIVNIDFHKRPTPMGPPLELRVDRVDFLSIANQAGLAVSAEHDLLEHQYFVELVTK